MFPKKDETSRVYSEMALHRLNMSHDNLMRSILYEEIVIK